jgi:polyphenol oxidase
VPKKHAMKLHNTTSLYIYFGDEQDKQFPDTYLHLPPDTNSFSIPAYAHLQDVMHLEQLIFLHQVHGTHGEIITSKDDIKKIKRFNTEGDYLVTNQPLVGLGVMTADCLPVVLYDSFNRVVSVIHAGWRGSVNNIVLKAFATMHEKFGTEPEQITVFFGPCAKVCCYEIGGELLTILEKSAFFDRVVHWREAKPFFDLPHYNQLLLESVGVQPSAFQGQYNQCTMCDYSFYSYRRQGQKAGRQMTVVCLQ